MSKIGHCFSRGLPPSLSPKLLFCSIFHALCKKKKVPLGRRCQRLMLWSLFWTKKKKRCWVGFCFLGFRFSTNASPGTISGCKRWGPALAMCCLGGLTPWWLKFASLQRDRLQIGSLRGTPKTEVAAHLGNFPTICRKFYQKTASSNLPKLPAQTFQNCQLKPSKTASSNLPKLPAQTFQNCQLKPSKTASSNLPKLPAQTFQNCQLKPSKLKCSNAIIISSLSYTSLTLQNLAQIFQTYLEPFRTQFVRKKPL